MQQVYLNQSFYRRYWGMFDLPDSETGFQVMYCFSVLFVQNRNMIPYQVNYAPFMFQNDSNF